MAYDKDIEIRNKETLFEKDTNEDGSPIKEIVVDGEVQAEVINKDTLFEKDTNEDTGIPQKLIGREISSGFRWKTRVCGQTTF